MMRPDVRFENLNPVHARRLVDTANLARPAGATLWVLHEGGRVLRAWHDTRGRLSLAGTIEPSLDLAARWADEHGASDVRIVDLSARDRFLSWAQDPSWVLDLDGFEHLLAVHEGLSREGDGIIVYPRREALDRFVTVRPTRDFLSRRIDPGGVFLLGIVEGRAWWASLVVILEGGRVARVTTFDDLPEPLRKGPAPGDPARSLAREAAGCYRRKASVLLVSREEFEDHARRHWSGLGGRDLAVADPVPSEPQRP
jgi:hypothetical protein